MTNPKEKIVIRFEQWEAARAMLAALKEAVERPRHSTENADWWERVYAAIAQAEAAGIGEDDQP
jgi:hypothetical protein